MTESILKNQKIPQHSVCNQPECSITNCVEMSFTRMPQELWSAVVEDLPSLTGRHTAKIFGFLLSEKHQRHSGILNKIFETNEWASIVTDLGYAPFVFGDDLHRLFEDPKQAAYIALLTGDKSGKLLQHRDSLLSSLRAHSRNGKNEIFFHHSRIILNVTDALESAFLTTLAPARLFSYSDENQLRSACLYWQDNEYALHNVTSNDVVGAGGRASTLESISSICGVSMPHPKKMGLSHRQQFRFQHPKCPMVYTLLPPGTNYNGRNILGWRLGGG